VSEILRSQPENINQRASSVIASHGLPPVTAYYVELQNDWKIVPEQPLFAINNQLFTLLSTVSSQTGN